ncbi:hypothetical protein SIAM614_22442 [Stappia aggregata IAM 12614]|uniref:Uncharacterized protein n=1 Tax=Roseibium aggregatum (strain ATCC 25650 / DSM 13394 / JCM 20685 / NBRC 16684 / NCIMB 2208 / IAM 12614 / B1) TaxID=384765 RepID=A0NY44_ROSAI|nr:hypothetical protein [Roseibium aggregatum]EAV42388.1 hypothetical protein SIAM614_22442 [Stappia aggregata IAM 12614] [Roseibium aggregatum IAM 12614]
MSLKFEDEDFVDRRRVITASSLFSVACATILINTLILVFAFLMVWAIGGYLMLSGPLLLVLVALISGPTAWLCVRVGFIAFEAETNPENNQP